MIGGLAADDRPGMGCPGMVNGFELARPSPSIRSSAVAVLAARCLITCSRPPPGRCAALSLNVHQRKPAVRLLKAQRFSVGGSRPSALASV